MKTIRLVLGDQLSQSISSLRDIDPTHNLVLMLEVLEENQYVRHHQQKIILVLSAMRHFAKELRAEGIVVDYIHLEDEGNSGSFTGELVRAMTRHQADKIIVTEPGEWRVWEMMQAWQKDFALPVEIRPDDRFLCSRDEFRRWADGRKTLRMEFFYRMMRRKTGWLMDSVQPEGGRWNYDSENRRRLPADLIAPPPPLFQPDAITRQVMDLVRERFSDHFGSLENFSWAVTREDALHALQHFIDHKLAYFGIYQDAMKTGDDFLFHSILSPYINTGLLNPAEVCQAALVAYQRGGIPLSSAEGFIRQILGWREYIRGIYWHEMPGYARTNYFKAHRPLPDFFWTGETELHCLGQVIQATQRNAYAHHIQRLMITGNFALLAGIEPGQVEEWYLMVYADAFDWVELPNTHGMVLFADGGLLASKPYAASGAYIQRMSDYCQACSYSPKIKLGPQACPFNYLYWNFLLANQRLLQSNPRMNLPYQTLGKMDQDQKEKISCAAKSFLEKLGYGESYKY